MSTQQGPHSDSGRNPKLYRQAKARRIQHHQTSLTTTNAKGNSLGENIKSRKTHQNKLKMNWEIIYEHLRYRNIKILKIM